MRLKKAPEHILFSALVLSFVCKCSCSHETETNGLPKAKDMAMSLACVDKSDAPSWRLCRPFISYTLLR